MYIKSRKHGDYVSLFIESVLFISHVHIVILCLPDVYLVIMDPRQQSMNEVEEKMEQFKSDRADLQLKIVLGCSKSTMSRKRERMVINRYVQAERAK